MTFVAGVMLEKKAFDPVLAVGDAWPILELAEHDPDTITPLVPTFVVLHRRFALLRARNAGANHLLFQRISEPIGVIATSANN